MGLDRLFFSNRPQTSLQGLQRDVYEYTQRVKDYLRQAHLFSKILSGVTVGRAETTIPHELGVVPVGWRVLSPESPCSVYQTRAPDTKNLYLANGQPASGEDWATAERRRLLRLAGIDEARAGVIWDGFHAPGSSAATGDFGERWTVVNVKHTTGGGAVWRNGVAVIEQAGGIWTDNYLLWKGPGIIQDDATERAGMAVRFKGHVRPGANANNTLHFGLHDEAALFAGKFLLFSYAESVDATKCFINKSGTAALATTYPIATLFSQENLLEIVGTSRTWVFSMNGTEVGRTTTTGAWTNLKPILYMNTGTVVIDDAMVACDGAFPAPAGSQTLGDGSVVVSLEVV